MLGEQSITQLQKQPFSNMVTSLYLFTALQLTTLVRTHAKIPVPRVLTWNSDASNRTATEYIIMEKATGVQLFEVWGNTNELQRLRLIENITKIESQLSPIRFPAYGHLYFRHSIAEDSRILLDPFALTPRAHIVLVQLVTYHGLILLLIPSKSENTYDI